MLESNENLCKDKMSVVPFTFLVTFVTNEIQISELGSRSTPLSNAFFSFQASTQRNTEVKNLIAKWGQVFPETTSVDLLLKCHESPQLDLTTLSSWLK